MYYVVDSLKEKDEVPQTFYKDTNEIQKGGAKPLLKGPYLTALLHWGLSFNMNFGGT